MSETTGGGQTAPASQLPADAPLPVAPLAMAMAMETSNNSSKRRRSPSPTGDVQSSVRSKLAPPCTKAVFSSPVPGPSSLDVAACNTHSTPTKQPNIVVCLSSLKGERCFVHPAKVARAVHSSIFEKKIIEKTLQITGGGFGIRFEVANLDNLPQSPESVSRLGDWPVRCWVVDPDPTNNYSYGRIYPVSPNVTDDELMTELTILGGSSARLTGVYRILGTQADGTKGSTLGVRLKFKGPLPSKVAYGEISYSVRVHNLPVLQCFRCLSYGHGQSSCRGKLRCHTCSGFHNETDCSRDPSCLYCGGGHKPTSRLCPAYQQAQAITKEQQDNKLPVYEARQKLREIRPGSHRPVAHPVATPQPPTPVVSAPIRRGEAAPSSYAQAVTNTEPATLHPQFDPPHRHNANTLPSPPNDATPTEPTPLPMEASASPPSNADQNDSPTPSSPRPAVPHIHHHTPPRKVQNKHSPPHKSPRPKRQHTEPDLGIIPLPTTEPPAVPAPPPPVAAAPSVPPGRPIPHLPPPVHPTPLHSSELSAPFPPSTQASVNAAQHSTNNFSWSSLLSGLASIAFSFFTSLSSGLSFQECLTKILPSIFSLLSSLST